MRCVGTGGPTTEWPRAPFSSYATSTHAAVSANIERGSGAARTQLGSYWANKEVVGRQAEPPVVQVERTYIQGTSAHGERFDHANAGGVVFEA